MKVAIVGGGIGGMTLALSLLDASIDNVDIYESSSAVKELGVGINVQPHAVRELSELGLLDDLYSVGIPTAELVYYSKHGRRIWGEPRGLTAGYRWPQFSIHRGELLGVLYRAVLDRLGPKRIHTSHHLMRFGQKEDRQVWGEFVDRATNLTLGRVEAELLLACDGVHSVVRRTLYPDLIMRHIFLTGHGGHEMLFCLRGRLWANVFGTNHRVHSSDDRARARDVAGGVVAPGLWETELAQPQR